jgi:hypothetical protein
VLDDLMNGRLDVVAVGIALLGTIVVAYGLAEAGARLIRTLLIRINTQEEVPSFTSPVVRRPFRVTRAIVFAIVFAALSHSAPTRQPSSTGSSAAACASSSSFSAPTCCCASSQPSPGASKPTWLRMRARRSTRSSRPSAPVR